MLNPRSDLDIEESRSKPTRKDRRIDMKLMDIGLGTKADETAENKNGGRERGGGEEGS